MAQLRNLIDNPEEVWHLKDSLSLLGEDITQMYRGKFEEYLRAKGEAMRHQLASRGISDKAALHYIQVELTKDVEAWKASRPRR